MLQNFRILARKLEVKLDVQSRAINFDRQGHSLTQKKSRKYYKLSSCCMTLIVIFSHFLTVC
jgi:hypothetical protein